MQNEQVVEKFCEFVNQQLKLGKEPEFVQITETLGSTIDKDDEPHLAELYQQYLEAKQPTRCFNQRIEASDLRFEQVYSLLQNIFKEDELQSRERYLESINILGIIRPYSTLYLAGRYWQVSGSQQYDKTGRLISFSSDAQTITDSIVAAVSGSYMSMQPFGREGEGIGSCGYLAVREHFRKGSGHGTNLLSAFEQGMKAEAERRGEKLSLFVLEARPESRWFFYKQGYRWPKGVHYFQPPLDFNAETGEPLYQEVPEVLMVKPANETNSTFVEAELLKAAVRTLYYNWSLSKTQSYPSQAVKRAAEYVYGQVFGAFEASLATASSIPLVEPPAKI